LVGAWAGSITDRLSLRKQLIVLELSRSILVGILPFLSRIELIYCVLFFLGVCTTFFGNAFLPYQTRIVPQDKRHRVNSISTMLRSGAKLLGPALSGLLLAQGQTNVAIWINAVSFLVSGITMMLLPEFSTKQEAKGHEHTSWWKSLHLDWREAFHILRKNRLFTSLYCLITCSNILGGTADSQEVVFAQEALHLGQFGFGMMVTAAGVGYVAGSFLMSILGRRIPTSWLIGTGFLLSGTGYLIYSLSHRFWWAVTGLIILGVFHSAGSVGFTTFTQNVLPISYMGRVNNVFLPPQQIIQVVFMLFGGVVVSHFGIRPFMIAMTVSMCVISTIIVCILIIQKNSMKH
jgi:MFS family permease